MFFLMKNERLHPLFLLDLHEENLLYKEKIVQLENERNQINLEKQLLKTQKDNFCNLIESDSKEKEKLKSEIEALKNEKYSVILI